MGFPYEPARVRMACVFALAALAAAVFAWLAQGLSVGWRVVAEIALVLVPAGTYAHLRKVKPPEDARLAREGSALNPVFLAIAGVSIALVAWLARTDGLSGGHAMLIIGAIVGAHLLTAAARDKRLRASYGAALGAILSPIVFLSTRLPLDFLTFLALALGVAGQALVWRLQLRALGRWP